MNESVEQSKSSVLLWDNLSLRQVDQLVCRWVQNWRVFETEDELWKAKWHGFERIDIPFPYAYWSSLGDCYCVFYEDVMDAEPYLPSRSVDDALDLYEMPLFTNAACFFNKKSGLCHAKLRTVEKRAFHGNSGTLPLAICQAVLTAYGIVSQTGEVYIP